jgi:hypothetical protein
MRKKLPTFMEAQGSLPLSEPPAAWTYPETELEKAEFFLRNQQEENKN